MRLYSNMTVTCGRDARNGTAPVERSDVVGGVGCRGVDAPPGRRLGSAGTGSCSDDPTAVDHAPPVASVLRSPATEARNQRTTQIDSVPTLELLQLLNAEDSLVPLAVRQSLPDLAQAVDLTVQRVAGGGRVHYFGAGTSGRIALMDAAELLPTFGAARGLFTAHHAGGSGAIEVPMEDAEDDERLGAAAAVLGPLDVAVGITASGATPYVAGSLRAARSARALTVLVTSNPDAALARVVDVAIAVDTGPEAIAGSTRLKAATAAKLVLNSFSTAVMVRLGRTYSNLMVEISPRNEKLRGRMLTILVQATGLPRAECALALDRSGGNLKVALVSLLTGCPVSTARTLLRASDNQVRRAVETATGRNGR